MASGHTRPGAKLHTLLPIHSLLWSSVRGMGWGVILVHMTLIIGKRLLRHISRWWRILSRLVPDGRERHGTRLGVCRGWCAVRSLSILAVLCCSSCLSCLTLTLLLSLSLVILFLLPSLPLFANFLEFYIALAPYPEYNQMSGVAQAAGICVPSCWSNPSGSIWVMAPLHKPPSREGAEYAQPITKRARAATVRKENNKAATYLQGFA